MNAVVEGTVLRSGGSAHIPAELVPVSSERHPWADTYESQAAAFRRCRSPFPAIVDEIGINFTGLTLLIRNRRELQRKLNLAG